MSPQSINHFCYRCQYYIAVKLFVLIRLFGGKCDYCHDFMDLIIIATLTLRYWVTLLFIVRIISATKCILQNVHCTADKTLFFSLIESKKSLFAWKKKIPFYGLVVGTKMHYNFVKHFLFCINKITNFNLS